MPAPPFDREATVGAGLQAMVAASLRSLRGVAQRGDPTRPETLHRFRVGLRRLRSRLGVVDAALPQAERRALDAALGGIARSYARAREWDVFLEHLVARLHAALPEEAAIDELAAAAAAARRCALPPDADLAADFGNVAAACEAAAWLREPGAEAAEAWRTPLTDLAPPLLRKRHRRLKKALKTVDIADQAAFHRVRIRIKKLRYAAEMFGEFYERDAVAAYLASLIALQDVLGEINDALVSRALLAELPVPSRCYGLAAGWLARDVAACRERFPDAARGFRDADPFWR